jgi:hypothetical protein
MGLPVIPVTFSIFVLKDTKLLTQCAQLSSLSGESGFFGLIWAILADIGVSFRHTSWNSGPWEAGHILQE